jgi:hypothetical protein
MGKSVRDFDVRHFDAAYKSGADVFATSNSRDFDPHSDALYHLSGVRVIVPHKPEQLSLLESLIAEWSSRATTGRQR